MTVNIEFGSGKEAICSALKPLKAVDERLSIISREKPSKASVEMLDIWSAERPDSVSRPKF